VTTILHLSDLHLPSTVGDLVAGVDTYACLDRVLDVCAWRCPELDAVVLTGDQTEDAGVMVHRRLRDRVTQCADRVVAVPGNHDLQGANESVWGGESCIEIGQWRLIGVDTTLPGEPHGDIDVERLCARLDRLDERWTVLAMHHPPVSPARNPAFLLNGADELVRAVRDRRHIRAVLTGHVHTPFEATVDGCALLGGPSTAIPVAHSGESFVVGAAVPVGARIVGLADNGSLMSELVVP
jgi:3',5'-cyclic-AMP phosphodiesterase